MTNVLHFAIATALLATGSAALAQAAAPKPISRADYQKIVDDRFAGVDTNHDGKLTQDELATQQQRDLQTARAQVGSNLQAKFKQLDTNKDGQLSLREFMAAAPPIHTAETPEQLLQRFDANRDGRITPDEFRAPEMAKFNKIDANHDGTVTPDELRAASGQK